MCYKSDYTEKLKLMSARHEEMVGLLNSVGIDLDKEKINERKLKTIETLFEKLTKDEKVKFKVDINYKFGFNANDINYISNVCVSNVTCSTYNFKKIESNIRKNLVLLKKFFKNVKFEERYFNNDSYYDNYKIHYDRYFYTVDFDTIKQKQVNEYLYEKKQLS